MLKNLLITFQLSEEKNKHLFPHGLKVSKLSAPGLSLSEPKEEMRMTRHKA